MSRNGRGGKGVKNNLFHYEGTHALLGERGGNWDCLFSFPSLFAKEEHEQQAGRKRGEVSDREGGSGKVELKEEIPYAYEGARSLHDLWIRERMRRLTKHF